MSIERQSTGKMIHRLIRTRASFNLRHHQMSWDKALYHAVGTVEADVRAMRKSDFNAWDRLMTERSRKPKPNKRTAA